MDVPVLSGRHLLDGHGVPDYPRTPDRNPLWFSDPTPPPHPSPQTLLLGLARESQRAENGQLSTWMRGAFGEKEWVTWRKGTEPCCPASQGAGGDADCAQIPYLSKVWAPDFAQLQSKNLLLSASSLTLGSQLGSLQNRQFVPGPHCSCSGHSVPRTSPSHLADHLSSSSPPQCF